MYAVHGTSVAQILVLFRAVSLTLMQPPQYKHDKNLFQRYAKVHNHEVDCSKVVCTFAKSQDSKRTALFLSPVLQLELLFFTVPFGLKQVSECDLLKIILIKAFLAK